MKTRASARFKDAYIYYCEKCEPAKNEDYLKINGAFLFHKNCDGKIRLKGKLTGIDREYYCELCGKLFE